MLPTSIQAFTPHQRSLQEMEDITALPEATMGPTSSNSDAKPRKMRASCDACSRAKVKCDKVRPTCQRCGNMNVCCNYSPSMRLGKPRKHRNPDGTVKREVSPGSYAQLGARFDLIPRTTSHTYESSPEPTDPFYFGPSTPEFQYQDAYVTNNFIDSRSPACSEGTVSLVGAWSSDEPMMFGNPTTDMFVQIPQHLPPHTPIQGHVRSTRTHSQPELYASPDAQHASPDPTQQLLGMPQPMYPLPEKTATESPSPMLSAPLPTPPASSTLLTHDCTASAFRTLNNLYAPPLISGHTTPTLESILSTTKASVDNLYALLTCDCTSTPHFSSTINTAILKILSWFQAIARAHDNRGLFSTLSLETILENYIPSHSTQHSNGGIDAETDCAARRTNIVLSELCRIEKLIDRFAERYCRYSGSSGSDITGIEQQQHPDMQNGVFLAMEAALRTKVRDTFRITMAVAPESVKRRMAAASRVSMAAQSSSSSSSSSRVRMNTV